MKIAANLKYKRKRATVDQKALKKVITTVSQLTAREAKQEAGKFRLTGALQSSIGWKVIDPKKDYRYVGIVGIKNSQYSKTVMQKGQSVVKIPNLYAKKVNTVRQFIQRTITGKDNLVRELLVQAKKELIVGK